MNPTESGIVMNVIRDLERAREMYTQVAVRTTLESAIDRLNSLFDDEKVSVDD